MPFGYTTEPIRKWRLNEFLDIIDSFEDELNAYVNNKVIPDVADYMNVVLNMCGKVFVTIREILTLCAHGYADGAMALSRNLFEQFVTLIFFESMRADDGFPEIVKDYYLDYDIQQSKAYKDYYKLRKSEKVKQYEQELKSLKQKASHKVSGVYWWTGRSNFADLVTFIYCNTEDEFSKNLLSDLAFSYKRACISIHACSLGNKLRLGNHHESNVIDTAPTIEGQPYVLWFAIASIIYILGITCNVTGIDFQISKEKLNELCAFYMEAISD